MGIWKVIEPEATTNLILNPSLETNITGWAWGANAQGVGWGRSSDEAHRGAYSAKVVCAGIGNRFINPTAFTRGADDDVTISVWARSDSGTSQLVLRLWEVAAGAGDLVDTSVYQVTTTWQRLTLSVADATMDGWNAGGVSLHLLVINDADDGTAKTWYVDGAQSEALDHVTTYVDGGQEGCEWNGTEHASTSTRSAQSRAGGRERDLEDYYFYPGGVIEAGMLPSELFVDEFALSDGGELNAERRGSRRFTLTGVITGTGATELAKLTDLHTNRASLIDLFKSDAVVKIDGKPQPVLLQYEGAATTKRIAAHLVRGLGGRISARIHSLEQRVALEFVSPDPFWRAIGNGSVVLDTNDSTTLRYIAGRLKSTGQWDDLGLTSDPTGATYPNTLLFATDGKLYIGGAFTGWDGVAGRDYVAYYDPENDSWSTWGPASTFNGAVHSLIEAPDGTIYAAGLFTDAGGNEDYIRAWTGSSWDAVGDPTGGGAAVSRINAMAFDSDGSLIVVGDFTALAGVAGADNVALWNGSAWGRVGSIATGGTGIAMAVAVDENDYVYVGGNFLNWNGDADADNLAWYNGTSWGALDDTSFNDLVRGLLYDKVEGLLYLVGDFTDAGGVSEADRVATWNGQAFGALGSGLAAGSVISVSQAPDRSIYVSGSGFTTVGSLTPAESLARWNGFVWSHVDINLSGTPLVQSLAFGRVDPVIADNFDIFVGFNSSGASNFSGTATVSALSVEAYPVIMISRSGGTSAKLIQIRNESVGKVLRFDYSLVDGETLTVNTEMAEITSDFFGSRPDALLAGCDLGSFNLLSSSQVTAFVDVAGAPTVEAYMTWKIRYHGFDD